MFATPLVRQIAAQKMALLAAQPGQSVLDVGCGVGVFLPMLAAAVAPSGKVVGLDHSAAMVKDALARVDGVGLTDAVTVLEGDACRLPFPDATFDAAHCERLLMHLEDPDRALAEMVRVVRPAGRIVVAEPDWAGVRIDHPDRADFDAIYSRSLAMRQPDLGLTLWRRLRSAGLTDIAAEPLATPMSDANVLMSYGLNLAIGGNALVADGLMTRDRADAVIAKLDALHAEGKFFAVANVHIVAARKPASR
jgi:SAM-dependent methyltransferase